MFYLKNKEDGTVMATGSLTGLVVNDEWELTTEDEYASAISNADENEDLLPSYEELQNRIDKLEAENAALLFEILTGEVIDDV